jgi:hypothetical protein
MAILSIQLFIIYVLIQQRQGQVQTARGHAENKNIKSTNERT